ncbi:MAS20 protein import receptor-domain-containing protein [Pilobolus umbonatus]|nr:MAS20 protein import receptor-domain-containing protein [Pilobolus umbonatus]
MSCLRFNLLLFQYCIRHFNFFFPSLLYLPSQNRIRMAVKLSTTALISTAVVAAFGIGYIVYFDYKRRNDPVFKKELKRERKRKAKQEKKTVEEQAHTVEELINSILETVDKEEFPISPEEKEKYFIDHIGVGESLCAKGEPFYNESIIYFYKALKIYPAPLELVMIFQKTLPEKVFRIVVNIMAIEQQRRQNAFYEEFPPKETGVKFGILSEDEEKVIRGLVADKDFSKDDILFTESPLISALTPELEGSYCNYCMKKTEVRVECTNCDVVGFCSEKCQQEATSKYHQFLCINNKLENYNKEDSSTKFLNYIRENNGKYPSMIAEFLSGMVAEEVERNKLGKEAPSYSSWDHIERFKSEELTGTETYKEEATMIKEVLSSKVPGIEEFLTDEIYLLLMGKLKDNAFSIPVNEGADKSYCL